MVKKSARHVEDRSLERYVRIDGPWIRNQAQEAVETFIAPAIGIANAFSIVSRPSTRKLEITTELTPEDIETIIVSAKKTHTKEDERALVADTLEKLNIGKKSGQFGIFGFRGRRRV